MLEQQIINPKNTFMWGFDYRVPVLTGLLSKDYLNELKMSHTSIIHGDALSASIAAASILAKVTRDHYMEKMDVKYPNYGFKRHKGYCTKAHVEALEKYGPCKIHRKTFAPVSKYFTKQLSLNLFGENEEE